MKKMLVLFETLLATLLVVLFKPLAKLAAYAMAPASERLDLALAKIIVAARSAAGRPPCRPNNDGKAITSNSASRFVTMLRSLNSEPAGIAAC